MTPVEGEFVPFRRTDVVLSPSHAQEVAPISREPTQVAQAREAYYKSMQPAQYGIHMHNIKDTLPRAAAATDHSKVCRSKLYCTSEINIVRWHCYFDTTVLLCYNACLMGSLGS